MTGPPDDEPDRLVAIAILRADGTRSAHEVRNGWFGVFPWIQQTIGADTLHAVDLPDGRVLLVDHTGGADRPRNEAATALYQSTGYTEVIYGDAAVAVDPYT